MNIVYILKTYYFCCCSVTKSCPTLCNLMPGFPVLQCLLVFSNSSPLSQRCHSTISFPVTPFSSCLHSFSESRSFPMSQFFTSGCQSIGASASASVLSMNIQDLFPLGLTGLISLLSKRLSRVFSNTTVQNHQFFGNSFLESINSLALRLLNSPTLTSVRDYWKT